MNHVPLAKLATAMSTRQYQPVAIDNDTWLAALAGTVLVPTIAAHEE